MYEITALLFCVNGVDLVRFSQHTGNVRDFWIRNVTCLLYILGPIFIYYLQGLWVLKLFLFEGVVIAINFLIPLPVFLANLNGDLLRAALFPKDLCHRPGITKL